MGPIAMMGADAGRGVREQFVFAVVRGDMELNETKLSNAIQARRLRPATTEEISAIGAEAGYGSPSRHRPQPGGAGGRRFDYRRARTWWRVRTGRICTIAM